MLRDHVQCRCIRDSSHLETNHTCIYAAVTRDLPYNILLGAWDFCQKQDIILVAASNTQFSSVTIYNIFTTHHFWQSGSPAHNIFIFAKTGIQMIFSGIYKNKLFCWEYERVSPSVKDSFKKFLKRVNWLSIRCSSHERRMCGCDKPLSCCTSNTMKKCVCYHWEDTCFRGKVCNGYYLIIRNY